MATQSDLGRLDIEEQIVRISKLVEDVVTSQAETRKIMTETQYLPRTMIFQAMLATAALIGAGAALAKLFFP
jgi:hypothetical protein